ncbi:P-loop containing nucleoside triphosphate hydrolase [Artemisia annua]|uniref:P-loop containing nucleoside triphosphate hydrolase n=1 Tax=Artemisia annua TaxID=35608 RepID=A0A2U1M2G8_ARTAN|nr:P-loop containing nucleoside triphosphate hydrolase [Artemisia annua]
MDLCSGNRISGFENIKTLLQNTSFAQAIPGFKVFIIEECHLLTLEAWDELMSLLEGPYGSNLVFILISHIVDVNYSIACNITSRSQKYYFTKLNDEDVTTKLSRIIVSQSSIGLIPHTKVLDLLAAAVSGDAINTIRYVKKLSECKTQSARLCYILKLLVETERQLRSTSTHDQTSNIIATTFLDITSMKASNINNIVLPARSLLSTSSQWSSIGLIPHTKVLDLLAAAVSGDAINTIRYVKKLSECKTQSARLCYILKLLVETERQLRSTSTHDQTSNIIATTFLDITSMKASNINNIVLPARSLLSTSSQWSNITFSSKEYTHAKTKHQTQICEIKHLENI